MKNTVTDNDKGTRLDQYVTELLASDYDGMSRSHVGKLIEDGCITVNNKCVKAGYKLKTKDIIDITVPEPESCEIIPEDIPLDIVYEDDDILIVNKPKDMVVHPANGHYSGTLVNAVMYHCGDRLSGINGVLRPGIVHRIDKDTTGLLVICKNDNAHNKLAAQLAEHSINRKYYAIVHGNISEDGIVDAPIGRHNTDRKKMSVNAKVAKNAVTHYHVLKNFEKFTLIECVLETGRTHQIRVHMASIGHPVLGDSVYGPSKCPYKGLVGQTLHAGELGFIHPSTGEFVNFKAPLPEYFEDLLNKLK